jgi:lambda repressor-like predicted transcriptional regulator
MNRSRWLATAAAALAVVLGGGAALAATGSSNPASDFLGDVAKRLGISQGELEDAIEEATIARIDAAVDAGEITEKQGAALKEQVRSGHAPAILPSFRGPAFGPGALGHHGMFGPVPLAGADPLDTAAEYLGIDRADVAAALRDGKSLADLAKDRGKSVDGLEQALRDEIRKAADRAVDDGVLSDEEADRFVERLSAGVDALVEGSGRPGLGFGPRLRPPGPLGKGIFPHAFPGFGFIDAAAGYLGMDGADVRAALDDGSSLAELAKRRGKSVDGLERALRDEIRKRADRAVEDGVLTRKQADAVVERFGDAVEELVEGKLRGRFEFHFAIGPEDEIPAVEPGFAGARSP